MKKSINEALKEIEEMGLAEELKKKAQQEEEKQEKATLPYEEEGSAKEKDEEEGKENDKEEGVEKEEKPEEEAEEVVILRRIDAGFEKWLGGLSEEMLEQVVSRLMMGHENEKSTRDYTECVKSMEHLVRFCSKCRRTGCEKCDYVKCLRHVVRYQKPGDWWLRTSQTAVTGTVRYLKVLS